MLIINTLNLLKNHTSVENIDSTNQYYIRIFAVQKRKMESLAR